MDAKKRRNRKILSLFFLGLIAFFPVAVLAEETPASSVEAAKAAIEQARKAGAEQTAGDDYAAAKSWLSQAEKAYDSAKSLISMISTPGMKKAREEEILYLATMASLKALTAEAKAKRQTAEAELRDVRKDLADYRGAIALLKEKLAEAQKAREVQAKAESERRQLGEAQQKATEIEAQKRKELEEVQRKAAEFEAFKQKELQEARLKEAKLAADREKEAAEAKVKEAQLAAQRAKEELEMKAREEKLSAEKQRVAAMQAKLEALEQEKAMLAAAGKIPKATVKAGDRKIVITVLAINLFPRANELESAGKEILDGVGNFLKTYPNNKVLIQGHTDSTGKQAANQTLSEKRAQKVREYLVAYQNISPGRITAEGAGPANPVATNASEAGRTLNRRVEIHVLMGE